MFLDIPLSLYRTFEIRLEEPKEKKKEGNVSAMYILLSESIAMAEGSRKVTNSPAYVLTDIVDRAVAEEALCCIAEEAVCLSADDAVLCAIKVCPTGYATKAVHTGGI